MLETPTLQIVPIDSLVVHEMHDEQRSPPLIARLRSSGVLRNPPILAPLQDGTNRYVVLDGTNRTTALRHMGLPHVIAQIVQPDSANLALKTWNHVLWGLSTQTFIQGIKEIPSLQLEKITPDIDYKTFWGNNGLLVIETSTEGTFTVNIDSHILFERVKTLNAIVDSYKDQARMDRTQVNHINLMEGIYDDLCALVVFPPIQMREVLTLVSAGKNFPAGFTRFTISPRVLRVNYSLEELASTRSLEEKNQALKRWIQERVARKGIRFYTEATVLYDE